MLAIIKIQCDNILFTSKFGDIDVFVTINKHTFGQLFDIQSQRLTLLAACKGHLSCSVSLV